MTSKPALTAQSDRRGFRMRDGSFNWLISLTALGLLLLSLSGCALNRPRLTDRTTVTATNGVVTVNERTLKVTSFALWPAHTELEKQTASVGKTLSTGTAGLTQEGGGTNVVEALKAIEGIIGKIH